MKDTSRWVILDNRNVSPWFAWKQNSDMSCKHAIMRGSVICGSHHPSSPAAVENSKSCATHNGSCLVRGPDRVAPLKGSITAKTTNIDSAMNTVTLLGVIANVYRGAIVGCFLDLWQKLYELVTDLQRKDGVWGSITPRTIQPSDIKETAVAHNNFNSDGDTIQGRAAFAGLDGERTMVLEFDGQLPQTVLVCQR